MLATANGEGKASRIFRTGSSQVTKGEGNVKIKRGENITYSSEAIYYADEGRVVLKGRPKLVIYTMDEIKDKDGVNTNKKSNKGL